MKRQFLMTVALACCSLVMMAQCADGGNGNKKAADCCKAKAAAQTEKSVKTGVGVGDMAPEFTLTDIEGNALSLSSLRGKVVVLDFWGTWCGWCIKGMPDMKEYYEKYRGRFEIVGLDCGDKEDAWKAAVGRLELPWKHVYVSKMEQKTIMDDYQIQGFPTKLILDEKGRVVRYFVGEDPEFYAALDEVLR